MKVKKIEFAKMFDYKSASIVSNLIKSKKLVETKDGLIDLNNKTNKKWIDEHTKNKQKKEIKKQITPPKLPQQQQPKTDDELQLQIDFLNQKLVEKQKQTALLDLKIAKERREVVETEVLNRVITIVFDSLFKNLSELPSVYIDDLISIIKTNKKSPKEKAIKFLTDKIILEIKSGIEIAANAAKKYYEQE